MKVSKAADNLDRLPQYALKKDAVDYISLLFKVYPPGFR